MTEATVCYHTPVLLKESIDGLNIQPDGTYVDVTFGGGGHSAAILQELKPEGKLFGFDQDADAWKNLKENGSSLFKQANFSFVQSNFRYLHNWMRYYGVENIDGLLADLGVSSHHFDDESRGFSFRFDATLDMRMNRNATKTAAFVLNNYTESQLSDIFYLYGEIRNARQMARIVTERRKKKPFDTAQDFISAIECCIPKDREKKELAKVFQALRIEVNEEMEALKEMLTAAMNLLNTGGRLVVITYHSLEDRIVKNFIKAGNFEGKAEQDFFGQRQTPLKAINNKPILPDSNELQTNPRSRSAKLRIAQKL